MVHKVKIDFEVDPMLERASLKQQLAQYLEKVTPLKLASTFYKELGFNEDTVHNLSFADENALIDPAKSGVANFFSYPSSRVERVYVTKAGRTFCHKTLGFGVDLLGDEYAGIVKKGLEKFCKEKKIPKAKIIAYSQRISKTEYPGRVTGVTF